MKRINVRNPAAGIAAAGFALTLAAGGCGKASSTPVTPAEQANWKGAPMPAAFAAKLAAKEKAANAAAAAQKQAK